MYKNNEKLTDIERFHYLTSEFSNCRKNFERSILFLYHHAIHNIT